MSKMGISTVDAYCGAQIFEIARPEQRGRRRVLRRHARAAWRAWTWPASPASCCAGTRAAFGDGRARASTSPGFYKFKRSGEQHALQPGHRARAARGRADAGRAQRPLAPMASPPSSATASFSTTASPVDLHDLLDLHARRRAAAAQRRSSRRTAILWRFSTAAMSHGALSAEAHETHGHRHEPAGRHEQLRRGRRRPRPLRHREQRPHQAGGLGPLRRHARLPGLGRRAADQDGPGLQARRGRPAARPQGDGRDRRHPPRHAGRQPHLAAAAPRHLQHRRPGPADLRPAPDQPAAPRSRSSWWPRPAWAPSRPASPRPAPT